MTHFITDGSGTRHKIEEYGWDKGKATVCVDNYKVHTLTMYYREERTWDDHMGNTPCGYYVIVPIRTFNNKTNRFATERRRVYLRF